MQKTFCDECKEEIVDVGGKIWSSLEVFGLPTKGPSYITSKKYSMSEYHPECWKKMTCLKKPE